jgi:hypothetical protein
VDKNWSGSSNLLGKWFYINTYAIKESSFGGEKFWALFVVMKNELKTLLTDLKISDLNVKLIRYIDAGEDMTMKNYPMIKSFGIEFEFSGSRSLKGTVK